jgi:cytochrome oxidase Cu insertion factor (SCO1/SenC/PrrC family)
VLGLGGAVGVIALLVLLLHAANSPVGGLANTNAPSGVIAPAARVAAPNFSLATLGGKTFTLSAARGQVVTLYFLATTCSTCVQGSHDVAQAMMATHLANAQTVMVDLNASDTLPILQSFAQTAQVATNGPPIWWGIDTTGSLATDFRVQVLESVVVIDAQGRIAFASQGAIAPQQLQAVVAAVA